MLFSLYQWLNLCLGLSGLFRFYPRPIEIVWFLIDSLAYRLLITHYSLLPIGYQNSVVKLYVTLSVSTCSSSS
jgi:hypothetical protein